MFSGLKWRISAAEKRTRIRKLIFRIWLPLTILGIAALTVGYPFSFSYRFATRGGDFIFQQVAYAIGAIGVSLLILLIVNKFIPYAERVYLLDENGLTVSKGKKKKSYSWNDFKCFYPYSKRYAPNAPKEWHPLHQVEPKRQELFAAESEIAGDIFYLKKKPKSHFSKLYKSFVVIYSEPGNTNAVLRFLQRHLPVKPMKGASDSGLVFYEFK